MNKAKILAEALKLPPVDRAEVVEKLLTSFEFAPRAAIDALWVREAKERGDVLDIFSFLDILTSCHDLPA